MLRRHLQPVGRAHGCEGFAAEPAVELFGHARKVHLMTIGASSRRVARRVPAERVGDRAVRRCRSAPAGGAVEPSTNTKTFGPQPWSVDCSVSKPSTSDPSASNAAARWARAGTVRGSGRPRRTSRRARARFRARTGHGLDAIRRFRETRRMETERNSRPHGPRAPRGDNLLNDFVQGEADAFSDWPACGRPGRRGRRVRLDAHGWRLTDAVRQRRGAALAARGRRVARGGAPHARVLL